MEVRNSSFSPEIKIAEQCLSVLELAKAMGNVLAAAELVECREARSLSSNVAFKPMASMA